jgi:uncharacterized circularly permuted ATP-grasp superfamily protein/uncharacterized alpha-E superfamily protein
VPVTSTAVDPGSPLHPTGELHGALVAAPDLASRQERADRLLAAEGAGHLVHDLPVRADGRAATIESRPWRVDPLPVVLDAPTFRWLSLAVVERMEAIEAVVADLYGERRLVRERVVPPELLLATPQYRVNAVGARPRRWLTTYAVDVVLGHDGVWSVVQDLTDAPPGLGYALLDRSVMSRVWPELTARGGVASLARYNGAVRSALASASAVESPRIVLFSGGLDHPSYVDHSYLAVQLGVNLVEGADLVVRRRRVWLRTLDGLEAVDVVYRRLEDPAIDPLDIAARGSVGVPGLLQAVRSGGVTLANAHGTGIVEAPDLRPFLDAAIERVHPTEQTLPLRDHTAATVSTVPVAPGSMAEGVERAPVVIRLFAVRNGDRISVLPGGTGRLLADGDDARLPTACTAKDVWVLGQTVAPPIGPRLPQVDFGRSVPTRAADALYWSNRAAERAEAMSRLMRVVASRLEQDPGLVSLHGGAWTARMCRAARAIRRHPGDGPAVPDLDLLREELSSVGDVLAGEIGAFLTEATTVREFLSVTTGRVLSHLAELRASLQLHKALVDDLDALLADFAALAGLWQESTVRGPAWRIGDTGRRLERCLVVLDLLDAIVLGAGADPTEPTGADEIDAAAIEVLLAANDSLVAYRRRYRSDVEVGAAVSLLVHDASNPRSLAASIARLGEHATDDALGIGADVADRAEAALALPLAELVPSVRAIVTDAGQRIVGRWFSTPVNPIVLRRWSER